MGHICKDSYSLLRINGCPQEGGRNAAKGQGAEVKECVPEEVARVQSSRANANGRKACLLLLGSI